MVKKSSWKEFFALSFNNKFHNFLPEKLCVNLPSQILNEINKILVNEKYISNTDINPSNEILTKLQLSNILIHIFRDIYYNSNNNINKNLLNFSLSFIVSLAKFWWIEEKENKITIYIFTDQCGIIPFNNVSESTFQNIRKCKYFLEYCEYFKPIYLPNFTLNQYSNGFKNLYKSLYLYKCKIKGDTEKFISKYHAYCKNLNIKNIRQINYKRLVFHLNQKSNIYTFEDIFPSQINFNPNIFQYAKNKLTEAINIIQFLNIDINVLINSTLSNVGKMILITELINYIPKKYKEFSWVYKLKCSLIFICIMNGAQWWNTFDVKNYIQMRNQKNIDKKQIESLLIVTHLYSHDVGCACFHQVNSKIISKNFNKYYDQIYSQLSLKKYMWCGIHRKDYIIDMVRNKDILDKISYITQPSNDIILITKKIKENLNIDVHLDKLIYPKKQKIFF